MHGHGLEQDGLNQTRLCGTWQGQGTSVPQDNCSVQILHEARQQEHASIAADSSRWSHPATGAARRSGRR